MDPYPALISYVVLWFSLIGLWFLTPDDEKPATELMLIIIFVLLAAYFFKFMVRLNILFSAFVAIQSGICFAYGLELTSNIKSGPHEEAVTKSRRRREKRRKKKPRTVETKPKPRPRQLDTAQIALVSILALFLVWTASTSYNSARGYPLGLREDWFDSLAWIEENSEPDDVIMSWWDYGYWIQTYADRPTIADGATTNWTQIAKLAKAFVTTEAAGIEFCREYDVRYIMVDVSDDFIGGKWTAMAHIAKQNAGDYMGIQEGQTVIHDKGQQALLFKLASSVAMSEPFPLDEHFVYREQFRGERGGVVVVYEFVPNPGS
jgi:dolichyl-diphosphooligosaccharide--protein glycosyltransferase